MIINTKIKSRELFQALSKHHEISGIANFFGQEFENYIFPKRRAFIHKLNKTIPNFYIYSKMEDERVKFNC